MRTIKGMALAGAIILFTGHAQAAGWHWFADHVRPTGLCGSAREIAVSFYNTGIRTASGEPFIHSRLTAASRMPGGFAMGSYVHLRHPRTGHRVTVRINDAGPWGEAWRAGVRLDLSPAAFRALGLTQSAWVCAE